MTGTLYVVATPIGNLDDITLRAKKVLHQVNFVLTEDTRVTTKLLKYYGIDTHSLSYHQHSSDAKRLEILRLLQDGNDLALVTDAGTPGISDPGNELIDFLLSQDASIKIVPVPGASSLTAALSVCGFRADKFIFVGFLPKKKRQKLFTWLQESKMTFAFFDSPFRLHKTILDLQKHFSGEVRVLIAREMTKMYETLYRGMLSDIENNLPKDIKGEVVVVVEVR